MAKIRTMKTKVGKVVRSKVGKKFSYNPKKSRTPNPNRVV